MASAYFIKNVSNPVDAPSELGTFVQLPADGSASLALTQYRASNPVALGDVLRVVDAAGVSAVKAVSAGITFSPTPVP